MYDLLNVNTYVREYVNHSKLDKHIDRKEISVTMSICLESTIDNGDAFVFSSKLKIDAITL